MGPAAKVSGGEKGGAQESGKAASGPAVEVETILSASGAAAKVPRLGAKAAPPGALTPPAGGAGAQAIVGRAPSPQVAMAAPASGGAAGAGFTNGNGADVGRGGAKGKGPSPAPVGGNGNGKGYGNGGGGVSSGGRAGSPHGSKGSKGSGGFGGGSKLGIGGGAKSGAGTAPVTPPVGPGGTPATLPQDANSAMHIALLASLAKGAVAAATAANAGAAHAGAANVGAVASTVQPQAAVVGNMASNGSAAILSVPPPPAQLTIPPSLQGGAPQPSPVSVYAVVWLTGTP